MRICGIQWGVNILIINDFIKCWTPDINTSIVNVSKQITSLESTSMTYPWSQFSKQLHSFQLSYWHCQICATSGRSGTSGRNTFHNMAIILISPKYYISQRNIASKSFEYIFDVPLYFWHLSHFYHKCHKSDNVNNLTEKVQLLWKMRSRVIHRCWS